MVTINCAGVPDALLESEFFGHVRGSFTGAYRDRAGILEQADGGTVFLDEVCEMSPRLQALLLRFLETGEVQRVGSDEPVGRVDVRVIAASNRDPELAIAAGAFREDLFYRLNVIRIQVPPLRARREDIALLTRHFVQQIARSENRGDIAVDPAVFEVLLAYEWPGNIRELRNVVERALIRVGGGILTVADLPMEIRRRPAPARPPSPGVSQPATWERLLDQMVTGGESFWSAVYEPFMARDVTRREVREIVGQALERTGGDYHQVATLFHISETDFTRFVGLLRRYDCHVSLTTWRMHASQSDAEALSVSESSVDRRQWSD
jgi:DNA-binding NtrC family response regulator